MQGRKNENVFLVSSGIRTTAHPFFSRVRLGRREGRRQIKDENS